MSKKAYALIPSEREKECVHPLEFAYKGKIPCTGKQICHLCGTEKRNEDENPNMQ